MTAMNLIVQRRIGSAFLLADTAIYRARTGVITGFHRKTVDVQLDDSSHMAVSRTGFYSPLITDFIRSLPTSNLTSLLDAMQDRFPAMARTDAEKFPERPGPLTLALACFNAATGRPEGYLIASEADPPRGLQAGKLAGQHVFLTPSHYDPGCLHSCKGLARGFDFRNPSHWSPCRDGAAMLDAQRRDSLENTGQYFAVGGQGILTTVSRAGIDHRALIEWADVVGKPIDPSRVSLSRGDRWLNKIASWGTAR